MKTPEKLTLDLIGEAEAGTLPGLFRRRCEQTPTGEAYRQYDPATAQWKRYTWRDMQGLVARWQAALARERFASGERVAVLLNNSVEWVCFDQAAQSLGLVVVPLYTTDNPENIAYILGDCGATLLLVAEPDQWQTLVPLQSHFPKLTRVLCTGQPDAGEHGDTAFSFVTEWLGGDAEAVPSHAVDPHALATIVYTSGTTGRPKGVMLSHHNILCNAEAVLRLVPGYREDLYLSFLPLSHTFERTVGYYLPIMTGSTVAFARSVQELAEDLLTVRPTMLVSVPRIYERVYAKLQHGLEEKGAIAGFLFRSAVNIGWQRFEAAQRRAKRPNLIARMLLWPLLRHLVADKILSRLGGRLRLAISGGAPLSPKLSRCFIGLGLPLMQGYGLTEASPIVTANTSADNLPESVGVALPGIELKLGNKDELLVKGPNVMLGYWNAPEKTREAVDGAGWLHTGDVARIDSKGHVFIVGRLKEILVMSTGEKVPPSDLELAITEDPLFDQAMVIGEGKPHLAALIVLNPEAWRDLASALSLDPADPKALTATPLAKAVHQRLQASLRRFPAYARVPDFRLTLEPWTIEDGLITPTMKLKRAELERRFMREIRALYADHALPD